MEIRRETLRTCLREHGARSESVDRIMTTLEPFFQMVQMDRESITLDPAETYGRMTVHVKIGTEKVREELCFALLHSFVSNLLSLHHKGQVRCCSEAEKWFFRLLFDWILDEYYSPDSEIRAYLRGLISASITHT